ncbi:MAG: hypothetical protein IJ011_08955 [Clostridia bacterium]|nr:hypothetical protein [Clostridia bacterium]
MKRSLLKLLSALICLSLICVSLSSCAIFNMGVNILETTALFEWLFGNDRKVEDNAFIAYSDNDGVYHVCADGDEIEHDFKGTVSMYPSDDNWFAYVFDEHEGGTDVYALYAYGELESLVSSADRVVAKAAVYPGVVYIEGNDYRHYYDFSGDSFITKVSDEPENIMISDNGDTVVYSIDGNSYMCYNGETSEVLRRGMVPVGVSGYGEYVYGKYADDDDTSLYFYDFYFETVTEIPDSRDFLDIIAMNDDGDEVLFLTGKSEMEIAADSSLNVDYEWRSSVYIHDDEKTYLLGVGRYEPMDIKGDVAIFGDFKDMYFQVYTRTSMGSSVALRTVYVDKKYNSESIADNFGKIDEDEKYFYCVNDYGRLMQLNLKNGDEWRVRDDVVDFAVNEDGDVFVLDAFGELVYIEGKNFQDETIGLSVKSMVYYQGGDILYFEHLDGSVMQYKDGDKEDTDFEVLPEFTNITGEYTYVLCDEYDVRENCYRTVYYTDNGEDFEKIAEVEYRIEDKDENIYACE